MNIYEMDAAQIWAAWKNNLLTVGQVVAWQTFTGLYFNHKGEIINENLR